MVFGDKVVQPNYLSTAVAFQVLDEVTCLFGRFQPVMQLITDVLRQSVYQDNITMPPPLDDSAVPAEVHVRQVRRPPPTGCVTEQRVTRVQAAARCL